MAYKNSNETAIQNRMEFFLTCYCYACDSNHVLEACQGDIVSLPCCIGEVRKYISGYDGLSVKYRIWRTFVQGDIQGEGADYFHYPLCPCDHEELHLIHAEPGKVQKIIKKYEGVLRKLPYLNEDGTPIPG